VGLQKDLQGLIPGLVADVGRDDAGDIRPGNDGHICELGEDDIAHILETFLAFEESEESKIFDNAAFGYWKVAVERPLRIAGAEPGHVYKAAEIRRLKQTGARTEDAAPVIRRALMRGAAADPLRGRFEAMVDGKPAVVEYEPDPELRDSEQIPLQTEGGIDAFLRREVLPWAPDAWYRPDKVKVGYEISFNRYFYKPQPMRSLAEIRADILALERESKGLIEKMVAEPPAAYETRNLRVYADTSVIGGCEDVEFQDSSRWLMERFAQGDMTLALSPVVVAELAGAPRSVLQVVTRIPDASIERLDVSDEAERLAAAYIDRGALRKRDLPDAQHIALATLSGVDVLASWNFRHLVNYHRIQLCNRINLDQGYGEITIRTPYQLQEIEHGR